MTIATNFRRSKLTGINGKEPWLYILVTGEQPECMDDGDCGKKPFRAPWVTGGTFFPFRNFYEVLIAQVSYSDGPICQKEIISNPSNELSRSSFFDPANEKRKYIFGKQIKFFLSTNKYVRYYAYCRAHFIWEKSFFIFCRAGLIKRAELVQLIYVHMSGQSCKVHF